MKNGRFLSHLFRCLTWDDIDEVYVQALVKQARLEDIEGLGLRYKPHSPKDVTTLTLPQGLTGKAALKARNDLTLCGVYLVPAVLNEYAHHSKEGDCFFTAAAADGERLAKGALIGEIAGPARVILQAERIILNFLQHLSGIATNTHKYVEALSGFKSKLLDTRKTTPAFRVLEKYAVACGGAVNHRIGLFDRVMLKDNHLAAAGAGKGERLARAVIKAKAENPDLAVEVEVDDISQIPPVLEAEADVIMFDNFTVEDTVKAIALVGDRAWTECSGGINMESIKKIAALGPDFISTGALVHKSTWIDIGLDWE